MTDNCFISFNASLKDIDIPDSLNDPFSNNITDLAKLASGDFQDYIFSKQGEWDHNFGTLSNKAGLVKGKMFGVLVVRNKQMEIGYLRTVSGKLMNTPLDPTFVASVFDDATENFRINTEMSELTTLGLLISESTNIEEIEHLKKERNTKSNQIQNWLFGHYFLVNKKNEAKNIIEIFSNYNGNNPPSAAGECAAPKLLNHAFKHGYEALSIAEFWWGNPKSSDTRLHKHFYPACNDKCKPILEYMLS